MHEIPPSDASPQPEAFIASNPDASGNAVPGDAGDTRDTGDTGDTGGAGYAAETESEPSAHHYPVTFTGTGSEYFRIWIVNLLLTILTWGIYSAWAKVRKQQYFYRNTNVAGTVFNYHGRPGAILKGRLIALALIGFYNIAFQFSVALGLSAAALLAAALPWLILQSQRFRLHNSSYRGLRFRFLGSTRAAYQLFGLPLIFLFALGAKFAIEMKHAEQKIAPDMMPIGLGYLVFLCAWPYLNYRLKLFQHGNSAYGTVPATFTARAGSFYKVYGLAVLIFGVTFGIAAAAILFSMGSSASSRSAASVAGAFTFVLLFYAAILSFAPYLQARLQNLVWRNTQLGAISFASTIKARRLIFIAITNLLLIVVTLGLFIPFAAIRALKYRLESLTVVSASELVDVTAAEGAEVAATGEGAADLLDIDFSL